jgi:hypothetical protein
LKKIIFILFFFSIVFRESFSAENKSSDLLVAFDGICVQNIHNLQRIKDNAKVLKWKIIPKEIESLVAPDKIGAGYAMWVMDKGNNNFNFVGVNDADNVNSCTLVSMESKIDEVHELLKKNYKLKLEHKDLKNGPQEFWIYKIDIPNANNTFLFLTYAKDNINYPFLNMTLFSNYLPQKR